MLSSGIDCCTDVAMCWGRNRSGGRAERALTCTSLRVWTLLQVKQVQSVNFSDSMFKVLR